MWSVVIATRLSLMRAKKLRIFTLFRLQLEGLTGTHWYSPVGLYTCVPPFFFFGRMGLFILGKCFASRKAINPEGRIFLKVSKEPNRLQYPDSWGTSPSFFTITADFYVLRYQPTTMKFIVVAVVTTLFALGVAAKPPPQLFKRTVCEEQWCYDYNTGATNPCDCPGSTCQRVGVSHVYTCT